MKKLIALLLALVLIASLFVGVMTVKAADLFGIDVSEHQGEIDWTKVATEADFAIIRASVTISSTKKHRVDNYFEANYAGAKEAGVPLGCYFFVSGTTEEAILAEVDAFLEIIKGKQFEYPVYLDIEGGSYTSYDDMTADQITPLAIAALEKLEDNGYYCGLYTGKYFAENKFNMTQMKDYDLWVAHYAAECGYTGNYQMWQNSESGTCAGVSGNVDTNYCKWSNYPDIIKSNHLNKFITYPYQLTQKSLMLYDGELLDDVTTYSPDLDPETVSTAISLEKGQTGYALQMGSPTGLGNAQAGIGGLAYMTFDETIDLSAYEVFSFNLYVPKDLSGSHRIQINFCYDDEITWNNRDDGYNWNIEYTNGMKKGWYTLTIDKEKISREAGGISWNTINCLRFGWFNFSGTDYPDTYFLFDNLKCSLAPTPVDTQSNVTSDMTMSQSITVTASENQVLKGVYFGSDAQVANNEFIAAVNNQVELTVTQAGTYYVGVVNQEGEVASSSQVTFSLVNFDANGGDALTVTQALVPNGYTLNLPVATREGYTFRGWSTRAGATVGNTTTTVNGNTTLYAIWKEIPKQITDVTITDATFEYDGTEKSLVAQGVTDTDVVTYENNGQTMPGTYTVTVTVKREGYETLTLTATLTITGLAGDLNSDGTVDAKDALAALKHAVGKPTLSDDLVKLGDLNGDGILDAKDALAILKKAVGN